MEHTKLNKSLRIKSEDGQEIVAVYATGRKKMALAVKSLDENTYIKVASFDNVTSAQFFMNYLAEMIGATDEKAQA